MLVAKHSLFPARTVHRSFPESDPLCVSVGGLPGLSTGYNWSLPKKKLQLASEEHGKQSLLLMGRRDMNHRSNKSGGSGHMWVSYLQVIPSWEPGELPTGVTLLRRTRWVPYRCYPPEENQVSSLQVRPSWGEPGEFPTGYSILRRTRWVPYRWYPPEENQVSSLQVRPSWGEPGELVRPSLGEPGEFPTGDTLLRRTRWEWATYRWYLFSRPFYPKHLTVHSTHTHLLCGCQTHNPGIIST